jgi:hypothetical protein
MVSNPLLEYETVRSEMTLVFLCTRKSGLSSKLADDHFDKLLKAVERSKRAWFVFKIKKKKFYFFWGRS